jgi:MFS family permease
MAELVGHRLGKDRGGRFRNPGLAPSSEAVGDRHPLTAILRQIAPRRPSADAEKGMAGNVEYAGGRRGSGWRIAAWAIAALLLLLPLVAMQLTDEVNWDETDFIVFGAMLAAACGAWELAARMTGDIAYRAAIGVAVAAAFILVWMNLAVGIIGSEDNPANLMYGGVLAVAIIGAVIARFQPHGMARALVATALAQTLAGVIALIAGWGSTGANWPQVIVILTGFFAALSLGSALLFRKAAREQTPAGRSA